MQGRATIGAPSYLCTKCKDGWFRNKVRGGMCRRCTTALAGIRRGRKRREETSDAIKLGTYKCKRCGMDKPISSYGMTKRGYIKQFCNVCSLNIGKTNTNYKRYDTGGLCRYCGRKPEGGGYSRCMIGPCSASRKRRKALYWLK